MFECFKTQTLPKSGYTMTTYEAEDWRGDVVVYWGMWTCVTTEYGSSMAGGLPLYNGKGEYAGYHLEYKR